VARGLAPVGGRSAPESGAAFDLINRGGRFYDCFAAERGQAPSPQEFTLPVTSGQAISRY